MDTPNPDNQSGSAKKYTIASKQIVLKILFEISLKIWRKWLKK
jgi:hypothetical protein